MPLFWKPYRSDVTEFLTQLKQEKPSLESEQRQGRALLWDKPQDREATAGFKQARVAQQPYVYHSKS